MIAYHVLLPPSFHSPSRLLCDPPLIIGGRTRATPSLSIRLSVSLAPTVNSTRSCRRETVQCFMPLNILQYHSRSLKVIRNDTLSCIIPIIIETVPVSPTVSELFSAKNGVTLKLGLGVVQGR